MDRPIWRRAGCEMCSSYSLTTTPLVTTARPPSRCRISARPAHSAALLASVAVARSTVTNTPRSATGPNPQNLGLAPGPACAWQTGFEYVDLRDDVLAVAVYDDGSGPALYIGGRFVGIGTQRTSYIARWHDGAWLPVQGSQGRGTDGVVRSLLVWDDGSGPALYAGGSFTTAGGVLANHVARWNGTDWSALVGPAENGTSGEVKDLACSTS